MKLAKASKNSVLAPLANERGSLTVDYLFAFVLVMGFAGLFFALSLTLTMIQITQYATFASARTYMAGHVSESAQQELAKQKFQQLTIGNPVFGPLYANSWFEVGGVGDDQIARNYRTVFQDQFGIEQGVLQRSPLIGVRVPFTAKMLDFNIPFFGSTSFGDEPGGFTTYVNSFLSREPTVADCVQFNSQRWEGILALGYDLTGAEAQPVPLFDNGC